MTRDSVRRALRTFVITTLALFIPGLLGWLNELTMWAADEGQRPFPDGHGLVYLGAPGGALALLSRRLAPRAGHLGVHPDPGAERRDDGRAHTGHTNQLPPHAH